MSIDPTEWMLDEVARVCRELAERLDLEELYDDRDTARLVHYAAFAGARIGQVKLIAELSDTVDELEARRPGPIVTLMKDEVAKMRPSVDIDLSDQP